MKEKENELPVEKTIQGLRRALFDEINGLRTGETTLSKATAVHKLATQIILLTQMELQNAKQIDAIAGTDSGRQKRVSVLTRK